MEDHIKEEFRELLTGMLEEITEKSEATLEEMNEYETYADPADRATAESDRNFTLRLRDRERKLIKKIHEAMARIDDGTFGECLECGEEIGHTRLKARPMTTLCIHCKSRQEREELVADEE